MGLAICARRRRDTGQNPDAVRPNSDTAMRNYLVREGLATPVAHGRETEWVTIADILAATAGIARHCGVRGHAWLPATPPRANNPSSTSACASGPSPKAKRLMEADRTKTIHRPCAPWNWK